jgi:hypothetical protein
MKKLITILLGVLMVTPSFAQNEETTTENKWDTKAYEIVEWVQEKAQDVESVASEEIPLLIQEYLSWIFWENAISAAIEIIFVALVIAWCLWITSNWKKQSKRYKEEWNRGDFNPFEDSSSVLLPASIVFAGISIFFSLIIVIPFAVSDVKDCVKVKLAPRVILVEKAGELIK